MYLVTKKVADYLVEYAPVGVEYSFRQRNDGLCILDVNPRSVESPVDNLMIRAAVEVLNAFTQK